VSGPPPPADLDRRTPRVLEGAAGTELHRHDDREPCYAIFARARRAIEESGRNPSLNEDWFWEIAEAYGMGLAPG